MTEQLTEQEAFWVGKFGDEYTERNRGGKLLAANLAFFSKALAKIPSIRTCIEFGANIGLNLEALQILFPGLKCHGVEINDRAAKILRDRIGHQNVTQGSLFTAETKYPRDLVLSKGVLIHQNPKMLPVAYERLVSMTGQYLLLAEYYNPSPVAIPYRGHEQRLFKRDFAGEVLDAYTQMRLVDYGFIYHRDPNFPLDDISWFLLEKTKF